MDYQTKLNELKERISTLKPHYKFNAEKYLDVLNILANFAQNHIEQMKAAKDAKLISQLDDTISYTLKQLEDKISAEENYGAP